MISTFLTRRWGGGSDNPSEIELRAALTELGTPDEEHPDCWLSGENGWTISAYESGRVVLQNLETGEAPWHMEGQSHDAILRLWKLLQAGDIDGVRTAPWRAGSYDRSDPLLASKRAKAQEEAKEAMRQIDREFYNLLGPEDEKRPCRRDDCQRGSIQYSVFCKRHHFESIRHRECPFDD